MLYISAQWQIDDGLLQWQAIRAQGAGGQNVNKVSTALMLTLDLNRCGLPPVILQRLLNYPDRRISRNGVITIKAQQFRSQELNRDDARCRLQELLQQALKTQKARQVTKPSKSARKKRLEGKKSRGQLKQLRGRVRE